MFDSDYENIRLKCLRLASNSSYKDDNTTEDDYTDTILNRAYAFYLFAVDPELNDLDALFTCNECKANND